MAGAKTHQYHIVNPSIWPLIGAISALVFFAGMVRWMHDLSYGLYIIVAGARSASPSPCSPGGWT